MEEINLSSPVSLVLQINSISKINMHHHTWRGRDNTCHVCRYFS